MNGKKRLFLNWAAGLLLVLAAFYSAVSWLGRAAEESAAAALKNQVVSALAGDLAEGNLFKLGATLSRLNSDGYIRFAEIRQVRGGASELMYRTSGPDDGLAPAFKEFSCGGGDRLLRLPGGVGVATVLPGVLAGADCTAVFISSDLPADLKVLKRRITLSFGLLISLLMLFVLVLTLSWHKKAMALEVAAKTAVAEKEAAIGRLAAQVAHDIRSPLAALGAAAASLELPAEQRALISGAVDRMRGIADDLLGRYRGPGAGPAVKAGPQVCALAELIAQVIAEKRLQHKDGGVKLEFKAGAEEIKAAVEPKEFQRLLSNLLNNSVEAFDGPGAVTVSLTARDGRVLIEVKDEGKGIPPGILAKLGQKGETHGKAGGNGLGLYHARTSVESWGGNFRIGSEPGKGTTVAIELPAIVSQPSAVSRTVVLLDDDMLVHMNWKMAARAAGVELRACKKAEGLDAALAGLPKDTPLYIDSDLGGGVKGEEIAGGLHEKGFTDITMSTGHGSEKFAHLPWLKVSGKEPPFPENFKSAER
ncbi:MAG: HAMP domain-containing sensor histidine kinase [Elusimicrobiota bacterium]|nr:HAMP domain-containing sensor histidine kinase [Elusimicrobiota bacterium]